MHKVDLAIAWNFERTVLGAYRWLSDNYERGDCIFLFGFSRGAFQVRVVAAMIDKVGLIHKGNEMQIPFAYELYADPKSDDKESSSVTEAGSSKSGDLKTSAAERFKLTFSNEVQVHFIGVWDTVSSIGIARGKKMLPRTVDGMKHVCFFRHALALDERRVKFLPEYAYGGSASGAKPDDKNPPSLDHGSSEKCDNPSTKNEGATTKDISPSDRVDRSQGMNKLHPQILEVWFAGTHSDIGGGNVENRGMDRSRPPLRWMVLEARALGLRTKPFERELSRHEQINVMESLMGVWWEK
ncbi:uncharacterized protein LACBIDRAFT_304666 [Laccaria bicolor S238N-H82]|uniref:Predicted protein n=1 Tax=Laccaria bicolor (strain S238N-H82 / ATCC MYA-4686) TaxID=486041 RepID=B0DM38_LACBS|nr:uncharacterized protein LACBIDRAFT_304666 [Laccaria bicolor S238N-H82]EDR04404.1 predicted protein [Laccaria bicolor S238N-H82]|eukprot:XP_001884923.1 predicted protein [Laccaria bicolor S238N-H82]